MDLKSALTKLKTAGAKHTIPFLFCESDAKGRPLVLVGTITPEQKTKALTGAKSAKTATGSMSINAHGDLCLKVKGSTLPTLASGFAKAASNANARSIFKEVQLGAAGEADDAATTMKNSPDNNNNLPDKGSGGSAKSKVPPKNQVTSGYVDLSAQRETPTPAVDPVSHYGKSPATPSPTDRIQASHYGKSPVTTKAEPVAPAPSRDSNSVSSKAESKLDLDNNNVVDALTGDRPASGSGGKKSKVPDDGYVDDGEVPEDMLGHDGARLQINKDSDWERSQGKKEVQEIKDGKREVEEPGVELPPRKIVRSTGPAKKFPDPLRQSPVMAEILRQQGILRTKLETAKENNDSEKIAENRAKLEKLEEALEQAQRALNKTGMIPQQIGQEYVGEAEKVGWRAQFKHPGPFVDNAAWTNEERAFAKEKHEIAMRDWEALRDSTQNVTRYFTDEEREKSAIPIKPDGKFVDANGKRITTSDEYVMDAETGMMHRFTGGVQEVNKKVPTSTGKMDFQKESVHHSSVFSGKEVGGAGGMRIVDGELQKITNSSGHYKPGIGPLVQTLEVLLEKGALLSKEWRDKDGKELSGKPAELLKRVRVLQQRVEKRVKADPKADIAADEKYIADAIKLLNKLGAGPENKVRPVEVEFTDIKKTMTGAEVKELEKEATEERKKGKKELPTAEKFLRTGGDNKVQAQAKENVLKELKSKTADRRGQLDKEYTTTGEGSVDPTGEVLDAAALGVDPSELESAPSASEEQAQEGTASTGYSKE